MLHKNQWKVFKLFKVEISQFLGVVDKMGYEIRKIWTYRWTLDMEKQWYLTQNKMNLFVLSGHGSESFAAFFNGVILQKNNAAVITAAVTTAQITR